MIKIVILPSKRFLFLAWHRRGALASVATTGGLSPQRSTNENDDYAASCRLICFARLIATKSQVKRWRKHLFLFFAEVSVFQHKTLIHWALSTDTPAAGYRSWIIEAPTPTQRGYRSSITHLLAKANNKKVYLPKLHIQVAWELIKGSFLIVATLLPVQTALDSSP